MGCEKIFKAPVISDNSFTPKLVFIHNRRNCSTQDVFTHRNAVNLLIVYELDECLFGAVKLTKNADTDKYSYSGYGNGFDANSHFSLSNGKWGKDHFIFEVDNSSSVHADISS